MSRPDEASFEPSSAFREVTFRGRYDAGELLRALAEVMPPGLTLYVEGVTIAPVVATYFLARPAADPLPIRKGVIWPRPKAYHMPMTPANVAGLVTLMEHLAAPEVAEHLHAYRDGTPYLIWYDAWSDTPLYLRKEVSEEAVRRVCHEFGGEYRSWA